MIARGLACVALLPLLGIAQTQIYQYDGATEKPVGATYDAGTVTPGDTLEIRFRVRNAGNGSAVLQTLSLSGQAFRISASPSLPYTIAPNNEAEFRVSFSPVVTGAYSGTLLINAAG